MRQIAGVTRMYFRDPECLFEFAEVPNDLWNVISDELYRELWSYFLENCRGDYRREIAATEQEIKARQQGKCSMADLRDAGYDPYYGYKLVPQEIVKQKISEILSKHPPC